VCGSTSSVPALASAQSRAVLARAGKETDIFRRPCDDDLWSLSRPSWGPVVGPHEAMTARFGEITNDSVNDCGPHRRAITNSSSQTIFPMAESSRAKNTLISTSFWRDGKVSPILFPKRDAITPACVTKARERFQISHAAKSIRTQSNRVQVTRRHLDKLLYGRLGLA
jgi:hypothetical protein